ncbi:MauE/DoxX family redox-associated membrane protein [Nonomuraea angiospora]
MYADVLTTLTHGGEGVLSQNQVQMVTLLLRLAVGSIWLAAATGKARAGVAATGESVRRMTGLSAVRARRLGVAVIAAEAILGAAMVSGVMPLVVATASFLAFLALALVSGATGLRSIADGMDADCGCFGARRTPRPVTDVQRVQSTAWVVARNVGLALISLTTLL